MRMPVELLPSTSASPYIMLLSNRILVALALRDAADGLAMPRKEAVMNNREVGCRRRCIRRTHGNVVVAVRDRHVSNRKVGAVRRIDAVRIVRVIRGDDLNPPYRHAGAAADGDMEVRRILQRDLVERKVAGVRRLDPARILLAGR